MNTYNIISMHSNVPLEICTFKMVGLGGPMYMSCVAWGGKVNLHCLCDGCSGGPWIQDQFTNNYAVVDNTVLVDHSLVPW